VFDLGVPSVDNKNGSWILVGCPRGGLARGIVLKDQ
jgi:hypothetical protein